MNPYLKIDLEKIKENTRRTVEICHKQDISVLGVTKGFGAIPNIVRAFLKGGVDGLADSRMENIMELHNINADAPITLLRIPRLSNVMNVVQYTDASINSELAVIKALGEAAEKLHKQHQVVLMLDVGDLREGILKENLLASAAMVLKIKGIKLIGIATNMGCYGGIIPDMQNLGLLASLAAAIETKFDIKLTVISGGGTSSLKLVEDNLMPQRINQLRIGEGILLGTDTTNSRIIPYLYQDAFMLGAEVIEVKSKPSVPNGVIGKDFFGNVPHFTDEGIRKRAIVALGKQDLYIEGIIPSESDMKIMGASSDHLILDITDAKRSIRVGDEITFSLNYSGLLSASTSKFIGKIFKGGENLD